MHPILAWLHAASERAEGTDLPWAFLCGGPERPMPNPAKDRWPLARPLAGGLWRA
jgi:hypothetical protein